MPAIGVVDSGSDITIIGGQLFQTVAATARLRKRDFKKPDRTPRTYDQKPFCLDGKMELDIEFDGKTLSMLRWILMIIRGRMQTVGYCLLP